MTETAETPEIGTPRPGIEDNPDRLSALERFRAGLEAIHGTVPHFDPRDGGDRARVLLLLETPGPRGGPVRVVSRDNPTGTARNLTRFCAAAGLAREDTVLWNVVPWLIHRPGATNRAPTRAETEAGLALVPGLLALLPHLRAVVLCGRHAAGAEPAVAASRPGLPILRMPHPSPTYVCTAPAIAGRIVAVLTEAARLAADAPAPRPNAI